MDYETRDVRRSFSFQFHPELLADLREFNISRSHDYNLFKNDDVIFLLHGYGSNELDLFTTSEELGSGNFLWKPKGAILRDVIESYSKKAHMNNGYSLVNTPHIGKSILWETSGHLDHYSENMYPPISHDENNETDVGQQVKIRQCKPISKTKFWSLAKEE